jgi:hypothetical protein
MTRAALTHRPGAAAPAATRAGRLRPRPGHGTGEGEVPVTTTPSGAAPAGAEDMTVPAAASGGARLLVCPA